jgi:hypothetical protein
MAGHPSVYSLNFEARRNQYDLWPDFAARAAAGDALVLVIDEIVGEGAREHAAIAALRPHFQIVQQGESVALARDGDVIRTLRIWWLDGWRGTWPPASLR